jgi:crossover junction endodeoxyribonuclease RusA
VLELHGGRALRRTLLPGVRREVREDAVILEGVFVPHVPAVQGNHRIGRAGRIYEASSASLRTWRDAIGWSVIGALRGVGPVEDPIGLGLLFQLPVPQRPRSELPIVRPDLDKLVRAVQDALTGLVYVDDSQIVDLVVAKRYGAPGCRIRAWTVDPSAATDAWAQPVGMTDGRRPHPDGTSNGGQDD